MTDFSEQRLPTSIRAEMTGGPSYATRIGEVSGGVERRNSLRSRPRRTWEFDYVQSKSDLEALYAFFLVMKGAAIGFRFKDPFDYVVASTEGRLGTGAVGTGEPAYQLTKRYSNVLTSDESIFKPVSGSVTVYRDASPVTVGAGAGQIAISTTTGQITFVADASQAISSHTPGASHVFTTASNITQLAIGDKVYLLGITGTADETLNGIAHTISNKTGAGPYTWTLATATTGLTVTGNGTAYAYPQADEALTWAGEFDRPVRFASDDFRWKFVAGDYLVELAGLSAIELLL